MIWINAIGSNDFASASITGRRHEAAELPLNQPCKGNCCSVFKIGPNDLYADQQAGGRALDLRRSRRKTRQSGYAGLDQLIEVGKRLSVDFDMAWLRSRKLMGCLIMSEGRGWHGGAKSLAQRRLGRKLDGCPGRHGSSQEVPSVEFWPHHGASRLHRPGSLL
jgi:hypothetical protein